MARQKKNNNVKIEVNKEGSMSEAEVLESLEKDIDQARLELEATKREIEEKKVEVASGARREVSADEKSITERQTNRSVKNAALQAKIEAQQAIDSQKVTGKFINLRAPGQSVKLTYMRYAEDPVKWYHLEDGKVYTIPRGFADDINNHYFTPKFIQKSEPMDPSQPMSQIQEVDKSNKKYAFVSTSY